MITELTNERDALELQVEKLQLQLDRLQRQNNDLEKELTTAVETPKVQEGHNQAPRLGPGFPLLQKLPETEAGSLCPSSSSPADRKVRSLSLVPAVSGTTLPIREEKMLGKRR